jgi:hypothetical protein
LDEGFDAGGFGFDLMDLFLCWLDGRLWGWALSLLGEDGEEGENQYE